MTAAYPAHFRTILRTSKSRSQPAAFSMAQPRRGYAYAQATGTDVPVFWDVAFRFTRLEAIAFQFWFRDVIGRGVAEFTMPIRAEFGVVEHVCRFVPDSLLPASEDGDTFGYTATIMARAQVIPAEYAGAGELIAGLPEWWTWGELIDAAVTAEMPGA
jgi:hypothetical protein